MFGRNAQISLLFNHSRASLIVTVVLAMATFTFAQQQAQASQSSSSPAQSLAQTALTQPKAVTIAAGTHVALVLTHPLDSKSTHKGDQIYAQTTAPVLANDHVAIPAGTFVQGTVEKLSRNGSRGEMVLQSVAFVFQNGYIATVSGGANAESGEGTAFGNPDSGTKALAISAPFAGMGIGALIGSAAHTSQSSTLGATTVASSTPKGLAIGSIAGLAAGAIVSVVLLASSHHFYVDTGSAMDMVLPRPVSIEEAQFAAALRAPRVQIQPIVVNRIAPTPVSSSSVDSGTCYTPGTSGTPDTVIPGTPPVGDSPGTPPIVIPGIPASPEIPHPCP
jgi:hypothetical protein